MKYTEKKNKDGYLFGESCPACGLLTSYADDTTYVSASKDREKNQENITKNMDRIKKFLNANDLCINESKSCIIEMMNKQKRGRVKGNAPEIKITGKDGQPETLKAKKDCRLLGANLAQDLTWTAHLVTGEKPLLPEIRKQAGAIKYISREIPKRSRKTLAEGLLISRIQYLLPMWGGPPTNT